MSRIAVLGCGPAGLFAAQALAIHGFAPVIISKKRKSNIYGAQFLHKPIPGLSPSVPTGHIRTIRAGSRSTYAERVYGLSTFSTSWDRVEPEVAAWDLRETYDAAWAKFGADIVDYEISPPEVAEFTSQFDIVISTIPPWAICQKPRDHYFKSLNIVVNKKIEIDPNDLLDAGSPDNWVIYNGTWDYAWYRASSIFGFTSAEARAESSIVQLRNWEPGFKVVGTDCDCHPNIIRAGRMGTWTRGVLTHHAFERTCESISDQFGSIAASPTRWADQ